MLRIASRAFPFLLNFVIFFRKGKGQSQNDGQNGAAREYFAI